MKIFYTLIFLFVISVTNAYSQQQEKEKTPEEIAIAEAERLHKELELNDVQLFYADSILRHNYLALKNDFDLMKSRGSQDSRSYKMINEKWLQKNLDAFKLILDEQQYIKYLKLMGKGKEYKKGKDGKYYKKEPKKKRNKKK
jgi:hypothetical protein